MSELWDVYTIDRKLIGKTCIRGEQGKLADDMSGVLAQLIRVLKPGGILSIVKHNEYGKD